MIWFAVPFILGISTFNFFPSLPFSIIILCGLVITFLFFSQRRNKKRVVFIILIFTFGSLYSLIRHETPPEIKLPDKDVFIEGTVIDIPEVSEGKGRFTIDDVYIERRYIKGRIKLSSSEPLLPTYGDRISTFARLKEPSVLRNPGVYSYDFKKDGILAIGFINHPVKTIKQGKGIHVWIYKKRQVLGRIIDNSLSAEPASFHKAIIIGLKREINHDIRDAFSSTGLAHLLSISGTHFGLLAFIIFKFIRLVIKFLPLRILVRMTLYITPTQSATLLTVPVLAIYALISGASTPTIRSLIMVFIYMFALFLGRKNQLLNSLSIAALIILLWQPMSFFDLSFQLSFIAVLSIWYVVEGRHNKEQGEERKVSQQFLIYIKKAIDGIKTLVLITIAVVIVTTPIVAIVFKQFSLISPITNLIITPFVCFIILPIGLFTSFMALLFNLSSLPLSGLIDGITHFVLNLIKVFSSIPYSSLHIHNPSFMIIVSYFASLILIIKNKNKWRFLPFVIVVCLYLVSPYLFPNNSLKITFFDVGQGDASLVQLPDKKVMLIDGSTYEPDIGRMVIAPYLWSKGIRRVDFMVVSHPHPDHYGGLIYVMESFKVGEVWLNGRTATGIEGFFQKMQKKRIPYRILKRGDLLDTGGYKIFVFHPYEGFYANSPRGSFSNQNSDSLVLKIESNDVSTLFTGDIETEAEENLIHLGKYLKSKILKVPHHGGRTSSSERFLKAVNPQIAVVSVGKNNTFNHPHQETVERYKNIGARLFRTDIDGAITIISKNKSFEIKTYYDSRLMRVKGLKDEIRNLGILFNSL